MPATSQPQSAKAGPGPRTKLMARKLVHSKRLRKQEQEKKLKVLQQSVANFSLSMSDRKFVDLPMSDPTKKGLKKAFFVDMTDIQAASIPLSLKGRDVLGSARTGSGKTLAFLIPVLESLYRNKWGSQDGLGALILSPTRELAMQIFDVVRAIGGYHSFSAGLVIGGKNVKDESDRLARMNILVATPGRLLQHMDQAVAFDCSNLQILVLDEADRILDMGFAKTLNAVLAHLPKKRQTLLFSATQTDSVKDLARLSLSEPEIVGTREEEHEVATPKNLTQHYLVCDLPRKLDILFSFIKTHLQAKVLVFLSSCKQVQFVFETFCKLHPGMPLLHLHGKQKQPKRLDIFQRFTSIKAAVLLATDIAARGLDFPAIDWVVQADAPENAETYIHRVGRTARYDRKGQSLLFLLPNEEEGMLNVLKNKGINPEKIKVKQSKTLNIKDQLQSFCFQSPEIKYLGQRAFVSYVRSVHLHKHKDIFAVSKLPLKDFASALGLPGVPKVKFATRDPSKTKALHSPVRTSADSSNEESSDEEETDLPNKLVVRTKYDRMFERKNQNILSEHYNRMIDRSDEESSQDGNGLLNGVNGDDADDFMTLKRTDHELPASLRDPDANVVAQQNMSKRKARLLKTKKGLVKLKGSLGKRVVFDDEGVAHDAYAMKDGEEFKAGGADLAVLQAGRAFAEKERTKLKEADIDDKQLAKTKKQEKKRKRKEREVAERGEVSGGPIAYLGPREDGGGYVSPEFDLSSLASDEERFQKPAKRQKGVDKAALSSDSGRSLAADEVLALRLLSGSR